MKNLLILVLCLFFSGCSLIPKISFSKGSNAPQSTEKSERTLKCAGEIHLDSDGRVMYCSDKFSSIEKGFKQKERKFTFSESVGNFISNLSGWFFWIGLLLFILFPGVIGWLIGRIFNGFRTTLEGTVKAIQRAKEKDGKYLEELDLEYSNNSESRKIIDSLRTNLKIKKQI